MGAAESLRAQSNMWHSTRRWLVGPLLALAVLGGALPRLHGQPPVPWTPPAPTAPSMDGGGPQDGPGAKPVTDATPGPPRNQPDAGGKRQDNVLRFSRNAAGDAKPILIDANEIHTWTEDGKVVLLLKGQVLVQQSVAQTR